MSNWTEWRKLAERNVWFNGQFDYDGPSCYELAIGGPNRGDMQIKYVGETKNETQRMSTYASNGSHLKEYIGDALRKGWSLYYHAQAANSKEETREMQDNLLSRFKYDWNDKLNHDDED